MLRPEVTAVITTHGRPEHVREALRSIRNERHADRECLVVEDGNALDGEALAGILPGVRLLQGGPGGIARTRNRGLEAARGEFVIFLDDDDVALPSRISTLIGAARRHDADLCYGLTRRMEAQTVYPDVPTHHGAAGPAGFCDLLTCTPHVNAVLVRADALRAAGGFDDTTDHFDDWSAWLRLADGNLRIWYVRKVVAEWRIHAAGLTGVVVRASAMKGRLLAMFDRLIPESSAVNAAALSAARQVVSEREVATYDEYVEAMYPVRERLHASGACLGSRMASHGSAGVRRSVAWRAETA